MNSNANPGPRFMLIVQLDVQLNLCQLPIKIGSVNLKALRVTAMEIVSLDGLHG